MKIPKKQKDIKLSTFLKYQKWVEGLSEEQKKDENYILKNTVEIFYELDDISEIPYTTLKDLFDLINNILSAKSELVLQFSFKGKMYGINPDFGDMTLGEMIDCNTDNVIQQIAVLYRPITKKIGNNYSIEKYKANLDDLKELEETLTLDIYLGFISFFLKIQQGFTNSTLKYLKEMGSPTEMKNNLVENGIGMDGLFFYPTKI